MPDAFKVFGIFSLAI